MVRTSALRFAVVFAAAALCLALACQSSAPVGTRAQRVVLLSLDGVGADLAWQWIADGSAASPVGLRGMVENGLSVERLRMVNPTLTAPNHTSLVTGRNAADTGVVSNWFRRPGSSIRQGVSGFTASSDAITLWEAARHAGLRVGTLVWPGADAGAVDRIGDFGVVWPGQPLASSEVLSLDAETADTTGEVPSNDGLAPLLWRVEVDLRTSPQEVITVLVTLVDSNPDGRPRYDTVAARLDDSSSWQYVGEREWFELLFDAEGERDLRSHRYASWCKVLHIDRLNGALKLYRGSANRLVAYPDAFEDRLNEAIGPWPGSLDGEQLAGWWLDLAEGIDLDTFVEQAERLDRYLDRMAAWVLAENEFDLLLAYHPTADDYQHASLITRPEQWAYSPGRALAAREGLKRVGRSLDQSVGAIWSALDPVEDALVVVSDHGMTPIFEVVRANRVLEEAGLLKTVADGGRSGVSPDTPMVATSSGGCVHLYLNLAGREPGGIVAAAEAPDLLRRAARAFAGLESEGHPAVEKIFTRQEAAAIGLDHPNTGDLVVFLAPGFAGSGGLDGPLLEPSRYYGQHGFLAAHDEMCGALFARGAGIKRTRGGEIAATAVAPMVARWLGFELVSQGR